jgi:hypothetical protein
VAVAGPVSAGTLRLYAVSYGAIDRFGSQIRTVSSSWPRSAAAGVEAQEAESEAVMDIAGIVRAGTLALAAVTTVTGIVAASYWLKASKVFALPQWAQAGESEPADRFLQNEAWIEALLESARQSGRLNATAARWTAIAAALGGLTAFVGSLSR